MTAAVLTPEIIEKLFDLVRAGNYPQTACRALGLNPAMFANWMRQGEGKDRHRSPSPETQAFAIRMREAEAKAEIASVETVVEGGLKDPTLALKFLSRRFRDRWGEVVEHKMDWTIRAIGMIKSGDVTWEDLEKTFDAPALAEIKARLLEEGATEGEFTEIENKQEVNA